MTNAAALCYAKLGRGEPLLQGTFPKQIVLALPAPYCVIRQPRVTRGLRVKQIAPVKDDWVTSISASCRSPNCLNRSTR